MRRIVLIFSLLLAVAAVPSGAHDRNCHEGKHHHCQDRECGSRINYRISGMTVYYGDKEVKGASTINFEILGNGYAKDTWEAYFRGEKIKGTSANSFKSLGWGYAADTWNVYFDGKKIKDASVNSFQVLKDGYAKDTWNVYFEGKKLKGAFPNSFFDCP